MKSHSRFTVETLKLQDGHALPFEIKPDQDLQIQGTKEEVEKEEAASEFVIEEGIGNGELKMFQYRR